MGSTQACARKIAIVNAIRSYAVVILHPDAEEFMARQWDSIDERAQRLLFSNVYLIAGSAESREGLLSAGVARAHSLVILSDRASVSLVDGVSLDKVSGIERCSFMWLPIPCSTRAWIAQNAIFINLSAERWISRQDDVEVVDKIQVSPDFFTVTELSTTSVLRTADRRTHSALTAGAIFPL